MIRIVGKGYKYFLKQLSDFLEISKTIVVSLKSIEGKAKYEKLFGRKLEDKKANPIIRIIPRVVVQKIRFRCKKSEHFTKSLKTFTLR